MALFKIFKGPSEKLDEKHSQKVEGYAYVAKTGSDSADFYVDYDSATRLKINKHSDHATLADTAEVANTLADAPTLVIVDGTTIGPKLTVGAGGKSSDEKTFPSASDSISGVITTGDQTLAGNKFTKGSHIGLVSAGSKDQFLDFAYAANPLSSTAPGASWRLGALHSGSGDANYFVIQTGGSSTTASTWNNAVRIGMDTLDVTLGNSLLPKTTNTQTIGSSSLKWKNIYSTTFTGDLAGTAEYASRWVAARTVTFDTGDVTGSFSISGAGDVDDVVLTVLDDSHNHIISNVDGLQDELDDINDTLDLKAPINSPAFTGTPTAPTPDKGDKTTKIATTAFVTDAINDSFAAKDAMIFKGTIGTGGTVSSLPTPHEAGWTYRVVTAGNYAGQKCEIGDLVICITDSSTASNTHWTVAQTNIDGAVIRDVTTNVGSSTKPVYVNSSGVVKAVTYELNATVPADAKFTDTNYYHTRAFSEGLKISTGTGVGDMYVPDATTTQSGVITTTTQSFAGRKTFAHIVIPTSQPSNLAAGSIWIST